MTALYDFYKNPAPKGSKKRVRYHARVIPNGTISTDDLVSDIHHRSTLSAADIRGTLIALSEVVGEQLREGRRVHIEGLGFVQITLTCPDIQSTKEIRAESIHFKSVAFRPEAELKKRLRNMPFQRATYKHHSHEHTGEEINQTLVDFFQANEVMTREDFQRIFHLTAATANRRLKELRMAGTIVNIAHPKHPLYKAGEALRTENEK